MSDKRKQVIATLEAMLQTAIENTPKQVDNVESRIRQKEEAQLVLAYSQGILALLELTRREKLAEVQSLAKILQNPPKTEEKK